MELPLKFEKWYMKLCFMKYDEVRCFEILNKFSIFFVSYVYNYFHFV